MPELLIIHAVNITWQLCRWPMQKSTSITLVKHASNWGFISNKHLKYIWLRNHVKFTGGPWIVYLTAGACPNKPVFADAMKYDYNTGSEGFFLRLKYFTEMPDHYTQHNSLCKLTHVLWFFPILVYTHPSLDFKDKRKVHLDTLGIFDNFNKVKVKFFRFYYTYHCSICINVSTLPAHDKIWLDQVKTACEYHSLGVWLCKIYILVSLWISTNSKICLDFVTDMQLFGFYNNNSIYKKILNFLFQQKYLYGA